MSSSRAYIDMTIEEAKTLVASVSHWHHAFEIYPGLVTPGTYDPNFILEKMRLADDLRGLRVLDIGTSDGFFALQLARRGAEVIAIDYRGKQDHGYYVMELLNPIQIEYHRMNVYELADKHLGQFDMVLLLGRPLPPPGHDTRVAFDPAVLPRHAFR